MDSVKSRLETLAEDSQKKTNYVSWKFKLNLTLKAKDLYLVAHGIEVKPHGQENDQNVKNWIKKDLEAQTLIGLNVSSEIARKIANCTSANQMIVKLEMFYGQKSDFAIENLQRKFFNFTYDTTKSVIENCAEVQQYAEELIAEGEEVKESWIISRILGSLPQKLHHFRTAWDNAPAVDKNLNKLFERLKLEEDRSNENNITNDSNVKNALLSKQDTKYSKKASIKVPEYSSTHTNMACFKCGMKGHQKKYCRNKPCIRYIEYCKENYSCNICNQKGHFAKECPNKSNFNDSINQRNDQSDQRLQRRAFVTISLSSANMVEINSNRNCNKSWYQDCAATQHMTFHKEWFVNYIELEQTVKIIIGDSSQLEAIGIGDIELEAFDGNKWYPIILKDTLYVPRITFNLVSVSKLLDKNYIQSADSSSSIFKTKNKQQIVAIANRNGNLYEMMFRREKHEDCLLTTSIKIWHERLAHQNIKYVRKILNQNNIKYVDDWNDYICNGCTYGKQHRNTHPQNEQVSKRTLDLIHVDLCEMDIRSLGGAKYFFLLKDDFSHFRTVYFLKTKDEVIEKLNTFIMSIENQFERKIKCFKSDNGTEIKNYNVQKLFEKHGISHIKTCAYTPEQNGRIEREMRTIVEAARSEIHNCDLDENLWAEAINHAVFTINQTGTSSIENQSPAELWFGRKINIEKLKIFGSECYVYIQSHKRGKINKKSRKGLFVGYDLDSPCYRVYIPDTKEIVSSDCVIFNETGKTGNKCTKVNINLDNNNNNEENNNEDNNNEENDNEDNNNEENDNEDNNNENNQNQNLNSDFEYCNEKVNNVEQNRRCLRDRSTLKAPIRFKDYEVGSSSGSNCSNMVMIGEVEDIPISIAIRDQNWLNAMTEEFNSLIQMKTWTLVNRPKDIKPITCRWVLRRKQDKFKARLVARGFEQKEGIDYFETFSPVARHSSVRLILSHASSEKMNVITFDVKTAFLYGELQEEIYMHQPEGFTDNTGKVCKLNKSIYGLKQSPKNWNEKFSKFLKNIEFEDTDDDPCVYYNKDRTLIVTLFVDDGLVVGKDRDAILKLLERMHEKFNITVNMNHQGSLLYLGMNIKIKSTGIFINQPEYTRKILENYEFDKLNAKSTPMEPGMSTYDENFVNNEPLEGTKPYREAIGSLLYLSSISRPDISFAVNYLSRFNSNPMKNHWAMVKRIFQYLKATPDYGIFYDGSKEIVAYTDSDYGGDKDTGHSTSGIIVIRGGPVVWYTQKQKVVATSTAEAEYRAAVSCIDDICWIRRISKELKILNSDQPTPLKVDNQSAIHMLYNVKEGKITKGKKHVNIQRKFIQEHVGVTIEPTHVKSCEQLADILTKPLNRVTFEGLRSKIIKEEC